MPLPRRRKGEKRGAFVGRCMGHAGAKREFPDQDQRLGFCHTQARRPPVDNTCVTPISNLESLLVNYTARREMFDNRPHVVVPVVLLTEGVHVGSAGPTFYPQEEISTFAQTWNGVPVPVFHPEVDGQLVSCNHPEIMEQYNVGRLWNVIWDAGEAKLRGEVWIDIERARQISPDVLTMVYEGRPLEVSTGLFAEEDGTHGQWGQETYNAIARGIRPDHLALLPGGRGACSYEDGCGVRANTTNGEGGDRMADDDKGSRLIKMVLTNEEVSHEQLHRDLQGTIDAMDSPRWVHYLRAVYDDYFVYRAEPRGGPEGGDGRTPVLYKQDYSIDANGAVQIADAEPVEVKEVVSYKPTTNKSSKEVTNMGKDKGKGCCEEKVQLLIENEKTPFAEDDREWLSALTEDQIDKLITEEEEETDVDDPKKGEKSEVAKAAEEVANAAMGTPPAASDEKPLTVDEYIAKAPAEIREVLGNGLRMHRERKSSLVAKIVANERNKFSKEQLAAMSVEDLENIANFAQEVSNADYSGAGGANSADGGEEVYEMPKVNFDKDAA